MAANRDMKDIYFSLRKDVYDRFPTYRIDFGKAYFTDVNLWFNILLGNVQYRQITQMTVSILISSRAEDSNVSLVEAAEKICNSYHESHKVVLYDVNVAPWVKLTEMKVSEVIQSEIMLGEPPEGIGLNQLYVNFTLKWVTDL